ncbi:MAG TPA: F0F1 ATP synthase subunit B [Actinospica sp.]|nr:F0F1 ATP synthase subunit B [Actinospica sp.]HWG25662.1 F0F1 ATP synthase subunit B [Actinospica sp.]
MAPVTILADSSVNMGNPILPELPELIIGIISFAVVFYFLAKKLLPNIRKTLDERTEAIEGGLQQAEAAQAEAAQVKADAQAQLAELRHSTADIRAKAQADGAALVEQARTEAGTQKEAIIASAHAQLDADRNSAVNVLKADLGKLATELADKIVGERSQDAALQERIIDRFLDELDAKLGASQKVG